jgi:hypothetical protein
MFQSCQPLAFVAHAAISCRPHALPLPHAVREFTGVSAEQTIILKNNHFAVKCGKGMSAFATNLN